MGYLDLGRWREGDYDTRASDGQFVRAASQFRDRVTADGSSGFRAEPGRYHLYVSLACPWAHRTVIYRALKRLEAVIGLSVVGAVTRSQGWEFGVGAGGDPDPVAGAHYLHELYSRARPDYSGRVTVPVLWDRQRNIIVNNESSEIIRMLNSEFDAWGDASVDFYPRALRPAIDEINTFIYERINNGVYRAGFAGNQAVYEEAVGRLFEALDQIEARLARSRYLVGDVITEADWRLFPTLIRFDAVYVLHFKCNLRRIEDYPNLSGYLRDLYQVPGVAQTWSLHQTKRHYFLSHPRLNPSGLVPLGPALDFARPHGRDRIRITT